MFDDVKHEPAIKADDAGESLADAVARARVSYAAGTGVEHRVVGEWLKTWGTLEAGSFKEWLAAWNG